ncbi:hypothetical protein MT997_25355 [Paenibacillus sp. OVF10]|nr:hypothetical protein MT997_25355 [Paenibacillus sp. OVF10]
MIHTSVQEQKDTVSLRSDWIVTVLACGVQAADDWLQIQSTLPAGWRNQSEQAAMQVVLVQELAAKWSQSIPVHDLKELDITGEQVLQMVQRKGGPWLGQLMKHLLRETAIGTIENQHAALSAEVKRVVQDDQT